MNKMISCILILSTLTTASAQQPAKVTRVTYKMTKPVRDKPSDPTVSPGVRDFLAEREKAYDKVECELLYTTQKSIFRLIDKLELEGDTAYGLVAIFASGIYYKDLTTHRKIKEMDLHGKTFDVQLPFEEYAWAITSETKKINGYLCYKATAKVEEFSFKRNQTITFYPEVWFTPDIPCSFGPRGLDGLPGLVLEGKYNDHAYFYATTIVLDAKDLSIDEPTKGQKITPEQLHEILKGLYEKRTSID